MYKAHDITLAILSWGARKTLENTLDSYYDRGLDKMVGQKIIWFNEMGAEDVAIAKAYGYEYAGSSDNIGIAGGYKELVARATGSLFLFLENDWMLIEDPYDQIRDGVWMLETRFTDVVRYRHRKAPGAPLWSRQYAGNEMSRPEYLLESIHWNEHPEEYVKHFKEGRSWNPIRKIPYDWYLTDSRYANWTNNPTMFRTDFIKNIAPRFSGDVEIDLKDWWLTRIFNVVQGDGLFTHYRIG